MVAQRSKSALWALRCRADGPVPTLGEPVGRRAVSGPAPSMGGVVMGSVGRPGSEAADGPPAGACVPPPWVVEQRKLVRYMINYRAPLYCTPEEMREAQGCGLNLNWYRKCRKAGASHAEVQEAGAAGASLELYGEHRHAKGSHQQFMEAHRAGLPLNHYTWGRRAGVDHGELLEAHEAGVDLGEYTWCRQSGASHLETLEACSSLGALSEYTDCRWSGASHAEVLAAYGAGADLCWYQSTREAGADHREAMGLVFRGVASDLSKACLALSALREVMDDEARPGVGEVIAVLAQVWVGGPSSLASSATALLG